MPDILGTMFFKAGVGSRASGWSESHYIIGAADDKAALLKLRDLVQKRVQLLGAGVVLPYIRVSDISVLRDSQVDVGPAPPAMNPPVAAPQGTKLEQANQVLYNSQLRQERQVVADPLSIFCDFPWTALMCRMEGGAPYVQRRTMWLRGNPDYIQVTTSDLPQPGIYSGALNTYLAALSSGAYGFRAIDISPANPVRVVSSIDFTTTPWSITFTGPAPTVGELCRVSGVVLSDQWGNKYKNLNGVWEVKSAAGQVVQFYKMFFTTPPLVIAKPGGFRPQRKIILTYANAIARRWGKKATGSPFDPLHGKSTK